MIIGICGKSGSGKSTLAKKIMDKYPGVIHCDIDKIGHKALTDEKAKKRLVDCFGKNILINNVIDRKKLGEIVFNSENEMDKLTDITWEYMQKEIDKILDKNNNKIIILDWQLLPKSKYFNKCSLKILLDIPYLIRKDRATKRDNINEEAFKLREKASYKYNKNHFDIVIEDSNEIQIERIVDLL